MSLSTLIDRLSGRMKQREVNSHDTLLAAARSNADGKEIDIGAVEEALYSTRQSLDDFRQLCEREVERKTYRDRFSMLATRRNKHEAVEKLVATESRKFEEIRQSYNDRISKLAADLRIAEKDLSESADAREWLLRPQNVDGAIGVEYREALDRLQEAESALSESSMAVRSLKGDLSAEKAFVEQYEKIAKNTISGGTPLDIRERTQLGPADRVRLEEHEQRRDRIIKRLAEAEKDLTEKQSIRDAAAKVVEGIEHRVLRG